MAKMGVDSLIPKLDENLNAGTLLKSGQRYKNIVKNHGLPHGKPEAKRINCDEILPSSFNRLGRFLNVQYIQVDMVPQIGQHAYNPSRPVPGVVIGRTKPERIARLHNHAKDMVSALGNLLPNIEIGAKQTKECLGGNHLTMTIRCYKQNFYCVLSKYHAEVKDDADLQLVVDEGHWYFELDDEVPDDDCAFLAEFLNTDQNQNFSHSEDHLRGLIQKHVADTVTVERPVISVSSIIEKVSRDSVVKLRPDNIGDTAVFVIDLYDVDGIKTKTADRYLKELGWRYSKTVNPRELTVSANFHAQLSRIFGKGRPISKLAAMFLQYRGLTVLTQTRPNPDVSRSLDIPLLNALAQERTKLDEHELFCRENRDLFQKYFADKIGDIAAAQHLNDLEEATMRLLCGKSMVVGFDHGVNGKWSLDKARSLQAAWVKHVAIDNTALNDLVTKFGIGVDTDNHEGAEVWRSFAHAVYICLYVYDLRLIIGITTDYKYNVC